MTMAGARLLLVDDNVVLAESVADVLEGEGSTVRLVSTCADALSVAGEGEVDVALVSSRLPDGSASELVGELLAFGAQVIVMAGNASLDEAGRAVDAGAYTVALKPLNIPELLGDVKRALRQVMSTRESTRLKRALEESEAGLGTLVGTVHSLLLVLDTEGVIVRANQAVAEAVGVSIDDLAGEQWFHGFVHEEDREEALRVFQEVLGGDGPKTTQNRIIRALKGNRLDSRGVRWRLAAHRRTKDRSLVFVSGLDMSDTQELERRARLTEKLAAVGTLSAGLAHEIRNPLNAAGLQLRLLNRRLDAAGADSHLKEPVSLVQAELGRLSRLVGEFLQFARPTGLVRSKVDVAALAQSVVDLEAPAAMEKGAEILPRLPAGPAFVEGDSEKLTQVVLNLLRNAVEASQRGGRVELGVEVDSDGLFICVSDEGEGIPEPDLPRIFEPFYSTKPGGTGLGMSIVHSLVTLHGGDITVNSRHEQGTRVVVSLPATAP